MTDQPCCERPALSNWDMKLRIFVDTNILIDYIENRDTGKAKSFIELFRGNNEILNNIEIITSDYVLWEFYGHLREEFYIRELIENFDYWYVSANKECRRRPFRKISLSQMKSIGDKITKCINSFKDNPVTIEKLIDKKLEGFSELIEKLLQISKFSYSDAIVFASALLTNSHMILTLDETFSSEKHLEELKKALEDLPAPFHEIEFKKPEDFSTIEKVKKEFKKWFTRHNADKKIGEVTKVWPQKNVIAIRCFNNFFIKEDDYLCLVKFTKGTHFTYKIIKVKNLRDYETEKPTTIGRKVTIKLPNEINCKKLDNATVFLVAE